MCGATSAQKNLQTDTSSAYSTAINNAQSVFGASSAAFNTLKNTFAPIIAAGPSQQGFSQQQLQNENSQAVTQVGQEAKNEKAALGNSMAAVGGGTADLPSGGTIGANLSLAENAGNQTASELAGITNANYAQGNENYKNAVAGLGNATNVYSASTGATEAETGAAGVANTAATNVANANQSGWQLAAGALGGIAGAALNPAGAIGGAVNSGLKSVLGGNSTSYKNSDGSTNG